jgi:hypothetical protein
MSVFALALTMIAATPVSLTPVIFQCEILTTLPVPQPAVNVSLIAAGQNWEFDSVFAKLTGARFATSNRDPEGLTLQGAVEGSPKARFEALIAMTDDSLDRFALDWRVVEARGNAGEETLEASGVGACKQILPMESEGKAS